MVRVSHAEETSNLQARVDGVYKATKGLVEKEPGLTIREDSWVRANGDALSAAEERA